MAKILIIEDEKNLARFVELELQHEGYETEVQNNGRKGLDAALNEDFDAILLDLMLPELNGLEIARRVRQVKTTPIIMMTARDSVIDRVSGLDHGADDYIVKPFAIEELLARLRAVLRRVKIEKDASKEQVPRHVQQRCTLRHKTRNASFVACGCPPWATATTRTTPLPRTRPTCSTSSTAPSSHTAMPSSSSPIFP